MHAFAGQRVQISRQNRHQRFAFTGFHFGNSALVQDDTADDLNREGLHPEHTPGGLPCRRKRVRQDVIEGLPVGKPLLQFRGFPAKLLIRQFAVRFFPVFNRFRNRQYSFQFSVGIASEEFCEQSHLCLRK